MSDVNMSQVIVAEAFTELQPDFDKKEVISALVDSLVTTGKVANQHRDGLIDGAVQRESVGSTGIGQGIAIPHCRTDLVDEIICAFGRCPDGLDFDSLDGDPVYSVFLLLTPTAMKDEHLSLMKRFAGQIRKEHFGAFLRETDNPEALISLLVEFEEA